MKPDVIVVHPKDMFYPLWVAQLNRDRDLFGKVIVMMSQSSTNRDYTSDIKEFLKGDVILKGYHDDGRDWRNCAVNEALSHVQSDHVLFLEQDFMVGIGFFRSILKLGEQYDMVGFREGEGRFHPCCLLVNTDKMNRTSKDFSVEPDVSDHFAKFTREMESIGTFLDLSRTVRPFPESCHLAGLTQNYRLTSNFYNPHQFLSYLLCSLTLPQPNDWRRVTQDKAHDVRLAHGVEGNDYLVESFFVSYD